MKARVLAAAVAGFTFLCTVQSAYWPIINKPGTVVGWWQSRALAQIGFYLGLPALAIITVSPLTGVPQNIVFWLAAFLWAAVIYFLVAAIARAFFSRSLKTAA